MTRRTLLNKLSEHFGSALLVLSGTGVASIVTFRSKAFNVLKLVSNEEDDHDAAISKVAKLIVVESNTLKQDKSKYRTRATFENTIDDVSPTLQHLMSLVSKKLDSTLPSAMIGNVITSMVTNTYTSLQIALCITVRQKSVIECLLKFGVTASYDEILRFKASAAHGAARNQELMGIRPGSECLVQCVADNFDANISSQNGLQSTHALAILLTQPHKEQNHETTYIRRIGKEELSQEILPDIPVQRHRGPSKPEMPYSASTKSPLPLKVLASQIISASRAEEIDFLFLKTVVTEVGTPEYHGFNTQNSREQGHTVRPATKAIYLPLVDMTPAEPDTMFTAMVES